MTSGNERDKNKSEVTKPKILIVGDGGEGVGKALVELKEGVVYLGDEITQLGQEEPFESKESWVHNFREEDPKIVSFGISVKTHKLLLERRQEAIDKHVDNLIKSGRLESDHKEQVLTYRSELEAEE